MALLAAVTPVTGMPPGAPLRLATLGSEPTPVWDVFQRRLTELGYAEGRNVVVERRWSQGVSERVPALLTELLRTRPDVLVASMLPPPARIEAALCAPMLAIGVAEPYGACRILPVARMSAASSAAELSAAHLRLARAIVPGAARVGVVTNSADAYLTEYLRGLQHAATSHGIAIAVLDTAVESDVIAAIARHAPDALLVGPRFGEPHARKQLVQYATRRRIPTVGAHLGDGVVVAADYDWLDLGRRAADFVDQLARGAKPSDLPVDAPIKLDVVVDRRAAGAVGLTVPAAVLSLADSVLD